MKVVILCGGKGARMREETEYRPKPLVDIGGKPIIWHIMKAYSHYGINDFILCIGYKGDMLKQYFMDMYWRNNNFTIFMDDDSKNILYHTKEKENWHVTIVDTGLETMTGGRLKQAQDYIDEDEFLFTYGDGLSDINIDELYKYHKCRNTIVTLTGVHPVSPFGLLEVKDGSVTAFKEKPVLKDMINGGFMVMTKKVFNYIPDEDCFFEQQPLAGIAAEGQLSVYEHNGFWMAIDTFKDVEKANKIWLDSERCWKTWV